MKNMKFKLIALLLVIPILLIFTTSSVVKITPILVDVPVSEIRIAGDSILNVDVAGENSAVQLQTTVYPENATNKKVSYTAEAVEGADKADVLISEDGLVTPLSTGTVKITAMASDRTASVQIIFYSTKVTNVVQLTHTVNIRESEIYSLTLGYDYSILPQNTDYNIVWNSSNAAVAAVDKVSGKITGKLKGSTTVTGAVQGILIDSVTGAAATHDYTLSYDVTVNATDTETGISFGGETSATKPTYSSVTFDFSYNQTKLADYGSLILKYDTDVFSSASIEYENGIGTIKATFKSSAADNETYNIGVCAADNSLITSVQVVKAIMTKAELSVSKTNYKVSKKGQQFTVGLLTDAAQEDSYTVRFTSSNPEVVSVLTIDNECYATPRAEGTAVISAKLYKKNSTTELNVAVETVTITVYNSYTSLSFDESSLSFGLEKEFSFGRYNLISNNKAAAEYTFSLKGALASDGAGVMAKVANNSDKLIWTSSNTNIATITDGVVTLKDESGVVTFTVSSAYNSVLNDTVSASFKINCISDGVNVSTYNELMHCSKNKLKTVLQKDIELAPELKDANFQGYKNYLENVCTDKMKTTADNSYYASLGHEDDSYVRYCVEFTNDVFGNGHLINANYITTSEMLYGYSVFNGPLDIVRLLYTNSSAQNAAVKAQDNIVFLVKNDNVSIRNVELKGCSDSQLSDGDLTKLNNCGTVLEIVGDNCKLEYSRVNNGRTVVRVFGKPMTTNAADLAANPDAYRINADIGNCVLSYGREFLLKVGSNQAKKTPSVTSTDFINSKGYSPTANKDLFDDAAPYLTDANGNNYSVLGAKDDYFYDHYVMTDLTLRDSVLCNVGLFCIGLESKFAGLCLHGYDYSDQYRFGTQRGWGNVAGTSYPAVINMEGDVRFYDWKKVNDVNSDTLIEGDPQILNVVGLNMNVASLIDNYKGANADQLTVTIGGEKYVNGAIAFYGGGKNYSYVNTDNVSPDFNPLSEFTVPLSALGSRATLIYYSAGAEDFRFLLYGKSCPLSYDKQQADMLDNTAYSFVYRK